MGVALFPSFFCELICHFISPNAGVCWYPLRPRGLNQNHFSRDIPPLIFAAIYFSL